MITTSGRCAILKITSMEKKIREVLSYIGKVGTLEPVVAVVALEGRRVLEGAELRELALSRALS
jgi:hypothetical protein